MRTASSSSNIDVNVDVSLAPGDGDADARRTTLWFRVPDWASGVTQASLAGKAITPVIEKGYLRVDGDFRAGETVSLSLVLPIGLALEGRRFQKIAVPKADGIVRFRDVSVFAGPRILCTTLPGSSSGRVTIVATVDATGQLRFRDHTPTGYSTVSLSNSHIQDYQLAAAIKSASEVSLHPWTQILAGTSGGVRL